MIDLRLVFRLALRELRGAGAQLAIFVVCIALGVAAIAGVGSLSRAVEDGLAAEGRKLLGGDIEADIVHRPATPEQIALLDDVGEVSAIATMRGMARANSKAALIEIKAVDSAYPLYGAVILDGAVPPALDAGDVIAADPLLMQRLGIQRGDSVRIGTADLKVVALVTQEPDRLSGRPAFGPRVLMSHAALERTGLIQPGTLVRYQYRVKVDGAAGLDRKALADIRAPLEKTLTDSGFSFQDWTNPSPSVRRGVRRLSDFLTLVGLAALALGGLGVANAISAYLGRKRPVIATFKSLGASSGLVLAVYLTQALVIALAGIAIGLVIGAMTPGILSAMFGASLPMKLASAPQPLPLAMAALAGLLVTLTFVLIPLGRARAVPAAILMRAQASPDEAKAPRPFVLAAGAALAGFGALAVFSSETWLISGMVVAGVAALFLLFAVMGRGVAHLAGRLRPARPLPLKLAASSLGGPGSLAVPVLISLGAGLSLLAAIALVERSLVDEIRGEIPKDAPSYFFLDIPDSELRAFESGVASVITKAEVKSAPMMRGRIVALKGKAPDDSDAPPESRWVLNGDRGLTYSETLPEGSTLAEGEWWAKDYAGPPLVSFEADIARDLGLGIGDEVTVNILGRNVTAKIANLRKVDWDSLAINFVMVFSPSALKGAPVNRLATIGLPDGTSPADEARLTQVLAERFPSVSGVRVKDALEAASTILDQVMVAVRSTAALTLLIGAFVLAGAVATAQRGRLREAVLFKTLGATRARVLSAHLMEYALLATIAASCAVVVGAIAAWAIMVFAFELGFSFSLAAIAQSLGLALVLVIAVGAGFTWRALSARSAPALRAE